MKTKIIPFDLETAKEIQYGKIKGKIVRRGAQKQACEILEFNAKYEDKCSEKFIIVKVPAHDFERERLWIYHQDGRAIHNYNHGELWFDLVLELPEEATEEQHPIEESELYQAGYKVGFEAGRCVAFDEKKGCAIKKETPKHVDVEEVPTGDGSIVFLRHKKHEFKPFDKVLVRYIDRAKWIPRLFDRYGTQDTFLTQDGGIWNQCIPYEGNEHLVGTTDKPKEE